jgi:SAM-dependent methyltransferase
VDDIASQEVCQNLQTEKQGGSMESDRRHAPATQRNREPILAVLRRVLPATGLVVEIASGTGEHAAFFAAAFPGVAWQPTDVDPDALPSIASWCGGVANARAPIVLDVTRPWPLDRADAVVCINMLHISPWEAGEAMLRGAGRVLPPGGVLYLYGPYRRDGAHTAPSNAAFDATLRAQDPRWGVRDLETVVATAADAGLEHAETVEMPANNLSVVFRRR